MRVSHCFGACVLLATLTAASASLAAPTVQHDAAVQLSQNNLNNLIQFEDAHIVAGNLNQIDPCWLVNKQFFDSVNKSDYALHVRVEYISDGHRRHRNVTVSLADVIIVAASDADHDHGTFDTSQWVRVRIGIDVSRHPVDANTPIEGSVRMFHVDADDDDGHEA
jgi:hypothetical protein